MKPIILTISDIDYVNQIQINLAKGQTLTTDQADYLAQFLANIPASELLLAQMSTPELIEFSTWDKQKLDESLAEWEKLWLNIPGFDFAPNCYILDNDSPELLARGFVMTALFAPSLAYNMVNGKDAYHVMLKADGTATFEFPTFEDAQEYPELFNFKGSWKEAYYLLIETLKNGWPMEEFPPELQQFLKK